MVTLSETTLSCTARYVHQKGLNLGLRLCTSQHSSSHQITCLLWCATGGVPTAPQHGAQHITHSL